MFNWIPKILMVMSIVATGFLWYLKVEWLYAVVPILFLLTAVSAFIFRHNETNQLILFLSLGSIFGIAIFTMIL
ncbi:hypothetical protein [Aquisalibacillus elongatus]|uniref:Uncharacterized protein n=1 Tax=Aquisalibacillus elongatus TaxID=485577 RepID=A0A3N5B4R4_9BACI|nr:hypothetical protein [Aquisalibacillus elongatus]RPF52267.1 hypothetical protein EDC24_2260 [Aquisalibacillus elongatus]